MGHVLKIKDSNGKWVNIPAIKGESSYDIAVRHGFEGTEEEWIENERARVVAEEYRHLNEASRESAEYDRVVAEYSRASAERERENAELARYYAEVKREEAEIERRTTHEEIFARSEEILSQIVQGIVILEDDEIDSSEKLEAILESGGRAFFYSNNYHGIKIYEHRPFDRGIVFVSDFVQMPVPGLDAGSRTQLGISLDIKTYGQMYERYIPLRNVGMEGENYYDLTEDDWTPAGAYSREEIDNMFVEKVTAEQVGAYTKDETLSKEETESLASVVANVVRLELENHASNKDNPHNVKAEQIGVYTKKETENLIYNEVDPVRYDINNHISNLYNNPHNVTAEQVGAYAKEDGLGIVGLFEEESIDGQKWNKLVIKESEEVAKFVTIPKYTSDLLNNSGYVTKDNVVTYDIAISDLPFSYDGFAEVNNNKLLIGGGNATFGYSGYASFDIKFTMVDGNYEEYNSYFTVSIDEVEVYRARPSVNDVYSFSGNVGQSITLNGIFTEVEFTRFETVGEENGLMTSNQAKMLCDIKASVGDIDKALDELHTYAQSVISGGETE